MISFDTTFGRCMSNAVKPLIDDWLNMASAPFQTGGACVYNIIPAGILILEAGHPILLRLNSALSCNNRGSTTVSIQEERHLFYRVIVMI